MLTSLACRGATFCFTWMASFLVFVHCSGSSYTGKGQGPLLFMLFKIFYYEMITDSGGVAKTAQRVLCACAQPPLVLASHKAEARYPNRHPTLGRFR